MKNVAFCTRSEGRSQTSRGSCSKGLGKAAMMKYLTVFVKS